MRAQRPHSERNLYGPPISSFVTSALEGPLRAIPALVLTDRRGPRQDKQVGYFDFFIIRQVQLKKS